jgi:tRNA G46 methylase TrmB
MAKKRSVINRLWHKTKQRLVHIYEKFKKIDTIKDDKNQKYYDYTPSMRGYEPSNWMILKRIHQNISFSSTDVFADFGSGKGKMVFLAARYPFKRVIGIEISKSLHDIAQKNIQNTQKTFACKNIDLINMDVLDYEIPDDLTIAYFFNPFVNEIFIRVIDNIHHSFLQAPRPIWIVYKNPKMRHHLDTCSWLAFRKIHHNIAFYRTRT